MLAAIHIADTEGLSALSMRRVGHRSRDRDDVPVPARSQQGRAADGDGGQRLCPVSRCRPAAPDWRIGLEALCRLQWRGYQDHPWLAQYVSMTRPQLVPRAMAHTERAMALLAVLGLDVTDRLHMAVTLANYVRGTAVNLEPEAQAGRTPG